MLDEEESGPFSLDHKHQRTYWIIRELNLKQKEMFDKGEHEIAHRIVSISQPHVLPIVPGKAGREVKCGAKISLSLINGSFYLRKISWEAYNESQNLKGQIEDYKAKYVFIRPNVSSYQIYGTYENRQYMKSLDINFTGVELVVQSNLTRS